MGGGEWEEDTLGAVETGINKMDWKPYAKKVVVLVGDSPPRPRRTSQPLLAMIRQFKSNNGTFNTVDVAAEEHERFEREFWLKVHREEPPKILPLPAFYLADAGGLQSAGDGRWRLDEVADQGRAHQSAGADPRFGDQWQSQVSAFGRGLNNPSLNPGP